MLAVSIVRFWASRTDELNRVRMDCWHPNIDLTSKLMRWIKSGCKQMRGFCALSLSTVVDVSRSLTPNVGSDIGFILLDGERSMGRID